MRIYRRLSRRVSSRRSCQTRSDRREPLCLGRRVVSSADPASLDPVVLSNQLPGALQDSPFHRFGRYNRPTVPANPAQSVEFRLRLRPWYERLLWPRPAAEGARLLATSLRRLMAERRCRGDRVETGRKRASQRSAVWLFKQTGVVPRDGFDDDAFFGDRAPAQIGLVRVK